MCRVSGHVKKALLAEAAIAFFYVGSRAALQSKA
jgi:hypothetical protein